MKPGTCFALLPFLFVFSCGGDGGSGTPATPPVIVPTQSYQLVWSDEFSGPDGSLPDATRWTMETGGGGWGNNELETYTARSQNAHMESGNLVIAAISETFTGSDGITRQYTSSRLKTAGLFEQTYGRFEARIKI